MLNQIVRHIPPLSEKHATVALTLENPRVKLRNPTESDHQQSSPEPRELRVTRVSSHVVGALNEGRAESLFETSKRIVERDARLSIAIDVQRGWRERKPYERRKEGRKEGRKRIYSWDNNDLRIDG